MMANNSLENDVTAQMTNESDGIRAGMDGLGTDAGVVTQTSSDKMFNNGGRDSLKSTKSLGLYLPQTLAADAISSESNFFHGKITVVQAHGTLLKSDGVGLQPFRSFMIWEGSSADKYIISVVTQDAQVKDGLVTRENEELVFNGCQTGQDSLVGLVKELSELHSLEKYKSQADWDIQLGAPIAPLEKKQYKQREKSFKKFVKQEKKASQKREKDAKKIQRKNSRNSKRDSKSRPTSIVSIEETSEEEDEPASANENKRMSITDWPSVSSYNNSPTSPSHQQHQQQHVYSSSPPPTKSHALPPTSPRISAFESTADAPMNPVLQEKLTKMTPSAIQNKGFQRPNPLEVWKKDQIAVKAPEIKPVEEDEVFHTADGELDVKTPPKKDTKSDVRRSSLYSVGSGGRSPDKDKSEKPVQISNHVLPTSGDKSMNLELRRIKAVQNHTLVNEQARSPQVGQPTEYNLDAREQKRQRNSQELASTLVNDQVRVPQGPTKIDKDSTEIARTKKVEGNKFREMHGNVRLDTKEARTRKADASWNGKALQPGEQHAYPMVEGTLDWDRSIPEAVPALIGFEDNHTPFYFPQLYSKEDTEVMLHMAGEDGAFVFRPHVNGNNLKFIISVRCYGKVTHHLLSRTQPGNPFTLCCIPYFLGNQELSFGRQACSTLNDVANHLAQPRQYWPHPISIGIPSPTTAEEFQELMQDVKIFGDQRRQSRDNNAHQSRRQSSAQSPEEWTPDFAIVDKPTSPPASKGKRPSSASPTKAKSKAKTDDDNKDEGKGKAKTGGDNKDKGKGKGKGKGKAKRDPKEYGVVVITGNVENAGSSGNVVLTFHGSLGDSDPINVREQGPHVRDGKVFVAEAEYKFGFEALDLGVLSKVTVEHNGKGRHKADDPDWFLDRVVVNQVGVGTRSGYHIQDDFPFNNWLSEEHGWTHTLEVFKEDKKDVKKVLATDLDRHRRNKALNKDTHAVNPNARGANIGEQTRVDANSMEIKRQKQAGNVVSEVRVHRGVNPLQEQRPTLFSIDSAEMSRQMNVPKQTPVRAVGVYVGERDKEADAVHSKQDTGYSADDVVANAKTSADRGDAVFR